MKTLLNLLRDSAILVLVVGSLTGCGTPGEGGGSASVSGGVYYGTGFYDPWYHGGYYYPPGVIVTPPPEGGARPPAGSPPRPENPIADRPSVSPRPTPSIPSTPRASFRR